MSRLCRLKTKTHGDDGKWAHQEITRLRAELASAVKDKESAQESFGTTWSLEQRCQKQVVELTRQRDELQAALEDIAQWTERYTQPGHPISTVARRAIASVKARP